MKDKISQCIEMRRHMDKEKRVGSDSKLLRIFINRSPPINAIIGFSFFLPRKFFLLLDRHRVGTACF